MSKLVAFAAVQGAYNIVSQVEGEYKKALETFNADTKVGFPNTAYYLPVIYSMTGEKVTKLADLPRHWAAIPRRNCVNTGPTGWWRICARSRWRKSASEDRRCLNQGRRPACGGRRDGTRQQLQFGAVLGTPQGIQALQQLQAQVFTVG